MADTRIELPQGTLDLLILKTVALGPQHGWAISERIQQISSDVLQVQQGSLYQALHRLECRGRKQLEAQAGSWRKLTIAVDQVLDMA